jgi:hypothetical protein
MNSIQDAIEVRGELYMQTLQLNNLTTCQYTDACQVMYELNANAKSFAKGRWKWT